MHVLITGALGWLGRGLTEVVSREHVVRAFDIEHPEGLREGFEVSGEVVFGDITNYESLRSVVAGQDAVIHAAIADTVKRDRYQPGDPVPFDVNVMGTYNLLEAGRAAGVRRFVLIGAAETHVQTTQSFVERTHLYTGDSIYDLTKRLQESIAEWFVRRFDLEIIVLRLGDVVDLGLARTKRDEANWKSSMGRDGWVDRYDVGEACIRALEIEHRGYDVFHLIGAPGAKRRFDVARAESVLGIEFTGLPRNSDTPRG